MPQEQNGSLKGKEKEKPATEIVKDKAVQAKGSTNVKNTITKFLLDQTVGALFNVVAFIAGIGAMKGKGRGQIVEDVTSVSLCSVARMALRWLWMPVGDSFRLLQRLTCVMQDFVPIWLAGCKVWPMVSLLSFAVIKSPMQRMLLGNLVGVGWNIFLSLKAAE